MVGLILTIMFAVPVAIFATQNTQKVTVRFMQYSYQNVPLYLIFILILLLGVAFTWILHLFDAFSLSWDIHKRTKILKEERRKNIELAKRLHKLELENAQLKAKYNPESVDEKSL